METGKAILKTVSTARHPFNRRKALDELVKNFPGETPGNKKKIVDILAQHVRYGDNYDLAVHAAKNLTRVADHEDLEADEAINKLVEFLKHEDADIRYAAVKGLLKGIKRGEDEEGRKWSIYLLEDMDMKKWEPNEVIRETVAHAIQNEDFRINKPITSEDELMKMQVKFEVAARTRRKKRLDEFKRLLIPQKPF